MGEADHVGRGRDIYRTLYADKVRYDELPAGIDYATLDGAVNSGVSHGAKWLQSALGVSSDGKIGSQTISAAAKADAIATVKSMCAKRMSFLRGMAIFGTFGRAGLPGWHASKPSPSRWRWKPVASPRSRCRSPCSLNPTTPMPPASPPRTPPPHQQPEPLEARQAPPLHRAAAGRILQASRTSFSSEPLPRSWCWRSTSFTAAA
ncbi:hypothetical protein GOL26_22645 [Sinorhizobium medicae]|nr:hypothetical protein [Sinorhizobium medicae]MDX0997694.1 hypothetical protein [Sinorhizobium medicae]MDX1181529.1 hypothetical protein [Sinorhizobium medicae]